MQAEYHENGTGASRGTPALQDSAPLLDEKRRELEAGSGIAPGIIAERGYGSVTAEQALSLGFSKEQARPGLLIPFYTPTGEISYQLKPDSPRVIRGKAVKYETRAAHDVVLDVHPANYWRLLNGGEPIYVIEGIKKADCAASRGRLAVGLSGVWNWGKKRKRGGAKYGRPELLPDWDAIPLEGRKVFVCFDADYRDKQSVALAMLRVAERLTERGAHVYIINLPGPEKGLDDYVVAGGDLGALEDAARPFTASNLIRYAAKRDSQIRGIVAGIENAARIDDWTDRSGATRHSLLRALLELALLGGRYNQDAGTVEVTIGTRELRHYAAIGSPNTLSRHTAGLGERGYIDKVAGERAKGKANRYILKLSKPVPQIGRGREVSTDSITGTPLDNFTPHLRWPSPASVAVDGDERDSKLPPEGATPENFPHEKAALVSIYDGKAVDNVNSLEPETSLGKNVELALHLLASWGGSATLRDLATATGVNHTGKLRAKLEEVAGVFGMDAKGKHGARVWLEDGWERRLDERRAKGGELRRARQQAVRIREAREAFKDDTPADEEPNLMGAERVEEIVEEQIREEAERKAKEVAATQRKAEQFVEEHARGDQPIRFGLLVEMWADEQRETEQHATWTLRKALSRLGYSLKAHADSPGEMFVYATGGAARVATKPKMPPKVNGVHEHGPLCDCEWCDTPTPTRYASAYVGSEA